VTAARTILFIDFYEIYGGGQHSLRSILAGLDRGRWRPVLAVNQEGRLAAEARALGLPVLVADMGRGRWRYFWKALPAFLKILGFAVEHGVSLVHSNGLKAAKFGCAVAGALFVPAVWHKRIHVEKAARSSTARLWRFYARRHDLLLAVSSAVGRDLKRIGVAPQKVRVLHNFVEPAALVKARPLSAARRKKAGLPAGVPLVGMVGARRQHKGVDLFIQAARLLGNRGGLWSRAHFVLLGGVASGEEAYEASLLGMQRDFPWPKRLHVLGEQDPAGPWLKSFKLLVCPSRREGFGRVAVEAMLAGCPVVAAYPEAAEVIQHGKTGWLAPPNDAAALAAAMKKALARPTAGLCARAFKSALRDFGPAAYFKRLDAIYGETLHV
jgi:glycosyltransferase involved in cell wall biosynthesis